MKRRMLGFASAAGLTLLSWLMVTDLSQGSPRPAGASGPPPWGTTSHPTTAAFSLDGVTLALTTSFLSETRFVASDPDSAIQTATAVEREPRFRELSITAVRFGLSPPTESLPAAGPGREEVYRATLKTHRHEQAGDPRDGVVMRMFGGIVTGSTSVVLLPVRGPEPLPVAISEWVTEADDRLWIVRASWELEPEGALRPSAIFLEHAFSDLMLSSEGVSRLSAIDTAMPERTTLPGDITSLTASPRDLPFPTWWNGDCDTVNFQAATSAPAYPLGAEYRGMKACGPRPSADGGPWRWVNFGAGNSQIEWQCPELSKRFLYLAYGIPPYGANGNQMVSNYNGDLLEKVWNCTAGQAPRPDDVLSYGATTTYGHTSVVVASDVDATGNGSIRVIEQNSSIDGHSSLYVRNWCVESYTDIIGWLHHPEWDVAYYRDEALTDRCASESRSDLYLFESWGDGKPADGCPADHFSARFSRSIVFAGGDYTFALGYDEGARLRIDGQVVIDGWRLSEEHYATEHLEAGHHVVSVEYHDRRGDAALTAFWWGPGRELARESKDASSWHGEYWGNSTLWWDPVVMVNGGDAGLDHQWFDGAPVDLLPVDYFSSRFRRTVPLEAGRWQFSVFADDGVRFWIDDQIILNEWQPQRGWFSPTVTMGGGSHALRLEHYEHEGWANLKVDWVQISEATTPVAWVASPQDRALIEACPVTVEAEVSDGIGAVDRVEFHAFYDGHWNYLGDDDSKPYTWTWDCLPVSDQEVKLTIHVWDDAGSEYVDLDQFVTVGLDHWEPFYLPQILIRYPREA